MMVDMTNGKPAEVPVAEVLSEMVMAPLPEGTKPEAILMLIKLDDGDWSVRTLGGEKHNRAEFLGQLVAYTHAVTVSEADAWVEDGDDD
jgi:hypothetical protein